MEGSLSLERTYYKTLHGTCITKSLKKPKPRKVGIFDVGTEKGPWMEEKCISSWWMVDLGEDHQEKTFIEQVVADESDMEGVPPACSRILNWHLHLAALDVPYPQGCSGTYKQKVKFKTENLVYLV
ncbi:hypothetical protein F2Q69_00062010 [Brassica cretica]|uniref:Glycosyltransferases n=1 Tax=Brassica cretica TaxID=69181 RepID=A0A8S9REW0_BRACR|nr:hypothetical protein F2Q69_00062010 [Brassica cretica]